MAKAIVDHGFPTTLWARRPESLEPFAGTVTVADSPAELASRSDLIGVCVVNDDDVREVVLGPRGIGDGLREGSAVVIHSTVHPDTCLSLAEVLRERGASVLDAPVSGGGPAAEARRLLVMVGGEAEILKRVRPVLATFGDPIIHLGPLGSGQIAKVVNNLLFIDNLALAHQAIEVATGLGLDREAVVATFQNGSSRSFGLGIAAGLGPGFGDPRSPSAAMARLLAKDLGLANELLHNGSVDAGLLLHVGSAGIADLTGGTGEE